jgi:lipopolysaccharide/colanic/teichoic acid biosynthesis glycosyltransferase
MERTSWPENVCGVGLVLEEIERTPQLLPLEGCMIKRILDTVLAAIGLVVLAPALVLLAIAIRVSSPGPVLYRGIRVGLNGKLIRVLKFRTMVVNAEALGGSCTSDDDARITPIGRWLRKYKLDELPQLFNILAGDMSIVGPRPEVQKYVDMFTDEEKQILSIRPGITDWATLWDSDEGATLAGSPDPERTYLEKIRPEKIRLQIKYVGERSLWVDLKIILITCGLVLIRCLGDKTWRHKRIQHSLGKDL